MNCSLPEYALVTLLGADLKKHILGRLSVFLLVLVTGCGGSPGEINGEFAGGAGYAVLLARVRAGYAKMLGAVAEGKLDPKGLCAKVEDISDERKAEIRAFFVAHA